MGGLNANIILAGTPAPAPQALSTPEQNMDALAKLRQYQQQAALAPLQRAQLANNVTEQAQKIQSYNEDQADHATWQQSFNNNGGNYDKTMADVGGQLQVRNKQAYARDHLTNQQALASLKKTDLEASDLQNKLAGQEVSAVANASDSQRPAVYAASYARMKGLGVDLTGFPATLPEDPEEQESLFKSMASKVSYNGQLIRDAQRTQSAERAKQQAAFDKQKADNALADENAKQMQRKVEDATAAHVGVADQVGHDAWLKSLDPDVRAKFSGLEVFDPNSTPRLVQQKALTTLERTQQAQKDSAQATADAREAAYQKNLDSLIASRGGDGQKQMKPNQAIAIEKQKNDAIAASKRQLDKDLAAAKLTEKTGDVGGADEAVTQAWNNHIGRIQDAQNAYEGKIGAATGDYPGHNDWADNLKAPAAGGGAGSGAGGQSAPAANLAPAAQTAPAPSAPLTQTHPIGKTMYGQDGKLYTITGYDPTGKVLFTPAAQPAAPTAQAALPPAALQKLKEGVDTQFGNGQVWTLRGGVPTLVSGQPQSAVAPKPAEVLDPTDSDARRKRRSQNTGIERPRAILKYAPGPS